uniref:CCHC-type domain-containing protein n=1 Tax=Setaria digitata TaxID=48799 RepID=A0A915PRC4_9BILA
MLSKTGGRALWIEELMEDTFPHQGHQHSPISPCTERLGCLNCNSKNHETSNCILPSHLVFKSGSEYPRRMVLLKLRCNVIFNPRHMLPYDYPLKGITLHVNRKDNCLYVRPQNLDEIYSALENFLFEIRQSVLCPATPSKINIGGVYLIRRQGSNVLARGVCAHMFFNWQMATQWQMYLIDVGQTEFVDQRSIYLLPSQLHSMPPMAIPLILANCRTGFKGPTTCTTDHFEMLNIGSTCVFALSSCYQGQSLSLAENGYYPSFVNSLYPPPLLARVFCGTSLRDEIFCKWGLPDITSQNHSIRPLYCPSTFSFNKFALKYSLPVTMAVRVTEKISQSHYWLRDASVCSMISKQIVLPSNGLWPYVEDKRSLACIAQIQRPVHKRSRYYRAIASNFNTEKSCCMVFLIDYGHTLFCDVHNLFDLSDQPPTVLYTIGAAFKCSVNRVNINKEVHIAKLAVDEKYIIQVIRKEDETSYSATIDMYIQADFQYPRPSASTDTTINNSHYPMLDSSNEISRNEGILEQSVAVGMNYNNIDSDSDNNNNNNNDNNSAMLKAILEELRTQISFKQEIENILQATDIKISVKLTQISNRIDELFNSLSLQSANNASHLLPVQQPYLYKDWQGVSKKGTGSQGFSSLACDGKDMTLYQSRQVRAVQRGCVICSQQRDAENQTSKSCCFCGAYVEKRQRRSTTSHHASFRRSVIPDLNATPFRPFTHVAVDGFHRTSTTSINSSSTAHSSCKNSNTPSNAESQLSSRSTSPADGESTNQESEENKNSCEKRMLSFMMKKAVIGDKLTADTDVKRWKKRMKETKKFTTINNSQDCESLKKDDTESQLPPAFPAVSDEFAGATPSTREGESDELADTKLNSVSIPFQERKDTHATYCDVNSQTQNISSNITLSETSHEMEDQKIPESCWICGKVGHLTKYCQSTPPAVWLLAQEMKKAQQKKSFEKPRDEKGRVLYTSDESSDDELNCSSDSDDGIKQVKNSSSLDHDIKLISDGDEKEELMAILKYKAYFQHVKVDVGHKYTVARSDDDTESSLWPLFFVQIQSDECQRMLEAHLDSLVASTPLTGSEMEHSKGTNELLMVSTGRIRISEGHSADTDDSLTHYKKNEDKSNELEFLHQIVGALCVAYCERFDAKFRAVITVVCSNVVEVFYVDYGNYEWVAHNMLWSIAQQDKITMSQPGMAIPCILSAYDQERVTSRLSPNDVVKMKLSVSCDRWGFRLKFQKQRPDGVCVVDLEGEGETN